MPPRDIPLEIILPSDDYAKIPQYMELSPGSYYEVLDSKWEQEEEDDDEYDGGDDEQSDQSPTCVSEVVVAVVAESTSRSRSRSTTTNRRRGSLVMTLKKTIMHPEDTVRLRESIASPSQPCMPNRKASMGMASLMEDEEDYHYDSDYDDDDDDDQEQEYEYPAAVPFSSPFRRGSLGMKQALRKQSMGMASFIESDEEYDSDEDDNEEEEETGPRRPFVASSRLAPIPPFRRGSLVVNIAHLPADTSCPQQPQRTCSAVATPTPTPRRGSLVMSLGYEVAEPTLPLRRQVSAPPRVPYRKRSMGTSVTSTSCCNNSSSPKYPTRKSSMDHSSSSSSPQCPTRKVSMDHSSSSSTLHSPKCPTRKVSMDHTTNAYCGSNGNSHSVISHHHYPTYPTRKPSMDHTVTKSTHTHIQKTTSRRGSLLWSVAPEEPDRICIKLTGLTL